MPPRSPARRPLLDRPFEQAVERAVARQQLALERRAAKGPVEPHRRLKRTEEGPALERAEGRVRERVARPDVAGVVGGRADRLRPATEAEVGGHCSKYGLRWARFGSRPGRKPP